MSSLTGKVLPASRLSAAHVDRWRELLGAQVEPQSAFFSPEYTKAVAAVRPHVYVCVLERAGTPVGFFPFQFRDRWDTALRSAERVGEEMTDFAGLVAEPDIHVKPEELLRLARLGCFQFSHLDDSQTRHGLTGDAHDPGTYIDLSSGSEAYLAILKEQDRHLIAETERRRLQLAKQFGPLHLVTHGESDGSVLTTLIDRKREQYRQTEVDDALRDPWKRELLHTLLGSKDKTCQGVLTTLLAGETWVASHFGLLTDRGVFQYWFPVYNTELKRYSPGRLLLVQIIQSAHQQGIQRIDRGAGDSPAKRDFANAALRFARGVWHRQSPVGLLARGALSLRWKFRI